MNDSVMMLASFEKTTDHLFNASFHARQDTITGVRIPPAARCVCACARAVACAVCLTWCVRVRVRTQVSESIIMGIPIAVGTGLFKLLRKTPSLDKEPKRGLLLDSLTEASSATGPSFTLDIASALAATASPIS
jgi:DNA-directed RNA polymerase III subunit RPC1